MPCLVSLQHGSISEGALSQFPELRTGLISATTVGGMDRCEIYYNDFLTNDNAMPILIAMMRRSRRKLHRYWASPVLSPHQYGCSSAANSIMLGARMIRAGRLDRVLAAVANH